LEELHDKGNEAIKKLEANKSADSVFNLEFLENMVKSCPIGNSVSIELKSNEPLRLTYSIGESTVSYFLAPYMEE
jgi:DNA polymerase III sliding clamp (beta) subunit (PCNA family)